MRRIEEIMKLIRDLPEIFEEFGEQRRNAFLEIKEYKDRGIPVIGMYCAYFPTELAMAVGAIPVGLCSFTNETISSAEKELPKSMCPLVKSSYGFAVEDKCPFLHFSDLVIGETTCDGKKKMYELMAEFKPVHVMELPNSQSERGLEFWKQEIIRTKEYFEEFFHVLITDEILKNAVHLNNQIRLSLKRLCEVMKLDPAPVLGEDIQKIVQGCKYRFDFETTPEVVNAVREKILEEYKQGKKLEKRPRILVTGCPIGGDSLKVIRAIEDNGGVVVAIENCSGVRTLSTMVDESQEDVYEAIARKYLSTGCSIMTPNDNRIELIGEIIDEYHVDGVVEMILTGCHSTGVESIYIRKFVNEEKHLPYIAIDTDYSSADTAQISIRLAAFLEMIQPDIVEKNSLDMNYCYKIVLSGITERKTNQQILEDIWEYTGIPVCVENEESRTTFCAGVKEQNEILKDQKKIIKTFSDKKSKIIGYTVPGISGKVVEELLDILVKSYSIKNHKNTDQEEQPDFLWIIMDEEIDSEKIYEELCASKELYVKMNRPEGSELFISGVKGKEDRQSLIKVLQKILLQYENRKVLVGNGFSKAENKEKNRRLQQYAFKMIKRNKVREQVCLIEHYYHELAVSYISREIGEESLYLDELERVYKEDREKGKDLYETLYWYLRMKRNVAQTAAKLKIHRNTLLPRIARLNEIMEVDEREGVECERMLMVMEMKKLKKK